MSRFGKKDTTPAATSTAAPQAKEPKQVQLFDIRTIQTKNGPKQQVKFNKDVTVQYKGENVDLGEYNSAFVKDNAEHEADLGHFVDKGYMTEEQAEKDVAFIQEKNISLRCKVPNPKVQS